MFSQLGAIAIFLSASSAIATSNITPPAEINYSVYSKEYPSEKLNGPVNKSHSVHQVMSPGERDAIFEKAGLTKFFKNKNHYDRDMFVLRAQNGSLKDLAKKYPEAPKKQLAKFQKLLQGRR
ncbi:hypothetical protein B9G69_009055 [Bdellovibrio sp. SKB1291214]|uniref:hypothetical protein n=1 Tax=Bdellovibrio sp. SKB1291214 TaxID=1732569 RepID=UPI000B51D85C|nr:hypothetical protein [Bdellovibrio sp. SKB1291214]UYL10722.1 hypothetical protein B9G69_009055 [Bdellovibrio sp. SKB1291214]